MPRSDVSSHGEHTKKKLMAGPSRVKSFVRFQNRTERQLDIIWINYGGYKVTYRTLKPKECCNVNTFVGHPWVFRDSETGEKLLAMNKCVYEPENWVVHAVDGQPQRKIVDITLPVYSLIDRCLVEVWKRVKLKDIDSLELPKTLKEQLKLWSPEDLHVDAP